MSMNDLQEAFRLIKKNKDKADFEEPKSEELIAAAEMKLGLKFPPTYRLFLKNYGCGDIAGIEIYGIVNNNLGLRGVPNGIWLTLDERETGELPLHFIIISDTGDGYWYCLDTSQTDTDGENPIVIWGLNMPEKNKQKVSNDFGEFLLEELQNILEEDTE